MDVIKLNAEPRRTGRSAARAARRENKVPCVLYGHGVEPVIFTVPSLSLKPLIFTNENHRVTVSLGGDSWDCILKDMVYDARAEKALHADFQVLRAGEKITLTVPLRFVGTPAGQVEEGGETQYLVHEVDLTCLPRHMVSAVEVDISKMRLGDTLHLSDVQAENVTFTTPLETPLVSVAAPRVTEEEGAAEAEGEAPADAE